MTLSTLKGGRGELLVEAAPLVPDRTICNPINDFKLGGVGLVDTSLSFVVSDMLNPPQQNTLNASLTQFRFIHRKRKGAFINSTAASLSTPKAPTAAEVSCFLQLQAPVCTELQQNTM